MALKIQSSISFSYKDVSFRVKESLLLKTQFAAIMAQEGVNFAQIHFVFCRDEFLLKLNQQFLNHDTYTDILTFTLSLPEEPLISEIYISTERVQENADSLEVGFTEELYRVMIHGLLHLCGFEDDTEDKKEKMRAREDFYLKDFPNSFT